MGRGYVLWEGAALSTSFLDSILGRFKRQGSVAGWIELLGYWTLVAHFFLSRPEDGRASQLGEAWFADQVAQYASGKVSAQKMKDLRSTLPHGRQATVARRQLEEKAAEYIQRLLE